MVPIPVIVMALEATEVLAAALFVAWRLRLVSQRQADRMRETYEVIQPRGMTQDQLVDAVSACIGQLPHTSFPSPHYAPSFDKYVDEDGKHYYIHMSGNIKRLVKSLLETKIPGIAVVRIPPENDLVYTTGWEKTIELGMTGRMVPLNIDSAQRLATSIDACFKGLTGNQAMTMQIVFIPGQQETPVDAEHKAKLGNRTLHAVIRLAATGDRAKYILKDLRGPFRSTHAVGSHFHRRRIPGTAKRINLRSTTTGFPVFLNADELSGFLSWIPSPGVVPPDPMIPDQGLVIAASNATGKRNLAIPFSMLPQHQWIIGPTGSGKSALIIVQAKQLAEAGYGFAMFDPKGDLCRDTAGIIPEKRIDDVIYFNPADDNWPIGFNILAGPDAWRTTMHVLALFKSKFHDSWGPRLEYFLKLGIYTAAVNGLTIFEVKELMRNAKFRAKYVARLEDKNVQRDWQDVDAAGDQAIHSIINKIDAFTSNPMIRNIVGQTNGINMRDIILGKKILLVSLDTVAVGEANAAIIAEMMIDQLWMAARSIPEEYRVIHPVIVDEFQKFAGGNDAVEEMLAMARSYKLPFIAAHQYTEQLEKANKALLPALENNARTKIVFGQSPRDAGIMAKYFAPLGKEELEKIPLYGVAMRIMTEKGLAPTATGLTFAPPEPISEDYWERVRHASRLNHARPKAEVEAEINSRYPEPEPPRKKARVVQLPGGGDDEQ